MATTQLKGDRNAWLKGNEARCSVPPESQAHPHRLVLLGAPGVGKGTQAELLSTRLGACHLSTGDIFRSLKTLNECERTPTMNRALEYMRRGELVPDEIVLGLVAERGQCLRCGGGFLLDGFPRTVAQAEALDKALARNDMQLEAVLDYELPLSKIVARLSGRRTCPNCKAVYHVETLPPKVSNICDICGSTLYQREDDRPESVRVRMDVYKKSTAPLTKLYRGKGLLITISAEGTPEEIFERTILALQKRQGQVGKSSVKR
jgi:adenylate kinase